MCTVCTPQILQQQYPHQFAYDGGYMESGGDACCPADESQRQKKHSNTSLVNTRAYWPYPSAGAIAAASYGSNTAGSAATVDDGTPSECQSPGACSSSLEFEAMAAVHRLAVAVRDISVSEMLPRTPQLIFVNVTTLEGQPHCLELTAKGWRITSLRTDCMQGDFTRMELFTVYYESVYDLMSVISSSFKQHASALASRPLCNDNGADADSEIDAGDETTDTFYEESAVKLAAGSRRPSLRLSATESHALHLCSQCSCVSLITPAGEALLDNRPSSLLASPTSCRCGAQMSVTVGEPESVWFSCKKLRNISEGCAKINDEVDDEAPADDLDTSSSSSCSGDNLRVSEGRVPSAARRFLYTSSGGASDASVSPASND